MTQVINHSWQTLCKKSDLIPYSGIAAKYKEQQVALFYIPGSEPELFALGNLDPFSGANVLARGLIGDLKGELMVAAPLYKQHFSLSSGLCMEDNSVSVPVFSVRLTDTEVEILTV